MSSPRSKTITKTKTTSTSKSTAFCKGIFIPAPNEISKTKIVDNLKKNGINESQAKDFIAAMTDNDVSRKVGTATFYKKNVFKKKFDRLLEEIRREEAQNPEAAEIRARNAALQTPKKKKKKPDAPATPTTPSKKKKSNNPLPTPQSQPKPTRNAAEPQALATTPTRKKPHCRKCGSAMEGHKWNFLDTQRLANLIYFTGTSLQLNTSDLLPMPASPPLHPHSRPRSPSSEVEIVSDAEVVASSSKSKASTSTLVAASASGSKSRSSSSWPSTPSFSSNAADPPSTQRHHPSTGALPTPTATPISSQSRKRTLSNDTITTSQIISRLRPPVIISDSESESEVPATPSKRRRTETRTGSAGIGIPSSSGPSVSARLSAGLSASTSPGLSANSGSTMSLGIRASASSSSSSSALSRVKLLRYKTTTDGTCMTAFVGQGASFS
ncbi:hypothetical protein BT96DRAFT_991601 [Gymnopus androsaceus JB14]|uniref:Uncharacterized protein n=1 Tax=Gymnopus androsaceus JB14 TaxID=1447944 RepID=A0A6A4HZB4_9AGAR|nr:hypothetical protein BT96DRAFT_991601 [Gymnopus androsaceus JB14]